MYYKDLDFNLSNPLADESSHEPIFESSSLPPLPNILPNTTYQVDNILDDQIITTNDGRTRKYLVQWKRKPPTGDMWVE